MIDLKVLEAITGNLSKVAEVQTYSQVLNDTFNYIKKVRGSKLIQLVTPFPNVNELDEGGLDIESNLVIGARPGGGKSAFATNLILHAAQTNKNVVFVYYNWEMSGRSQGLRTLSSVLEQTTKEIKKFAREAPGEDFYTVWKNKMKKYAQTPILFINSLQTVEDIEAIHTYLYTNLKTAYPSLDFIIVNVFDHTRLIKGSGDKIYQKEEEKIFDLMKTCNNIKKKKGINIILTQLNRNIETQIKETGTYIAPSSSHIFGADAVQQFADKVILLHRPIYYGYNQYKMVLNEEFSIMLDSTTTLLCGEVVKNREGKSDYTMYFHAELGKNKINSIDTEILVQKILNGEITNVIHNGK